MGDPFYFEDGRQIVDDLKQHQVIVGYTIFRAIKENIDISSIKDFSDIMNDVENDYNNLKHFNQL